jgi:Fe2+ transport system protein FeoA
MDIQQTTPRPASLLEMPSDCGLRVEELTGSPSQRSHLYAMGILPGTEMELCARACGAGSVCVRVRQCSLVLGESMAKAVAVLLPALGHDITIDTVLTHAEAADNIDGWMVDYSQLKGGRNGQPYGMYGPLHTCERWDLWKLKDYDGAIRNGGDVLRGKANWYKENGFGSQ